MAMFTLEERRKLLLQYHPEVKHLLNDPARVNAIWRDKFPKIERYWTARAYDQNLDWDQFRHNGKETITRKDGQMVFPI